MTDDSYKLANDRELIEMRRGAVDDLTECCETLVAIDVEIQRRGIENGRFDLDAAAERISAFARGESEKAHTPTGDEQTDWRDKAWNAVSIGRTHPTDDEREALLRDLYTLRGWTGGSVVRRIEIIDRAIAAIRSSEASEPAPPHDPLNCPTGRGTAACLLDCPRAEPQGEPSERKPEWPNHWTTNEKLRDLHARWHDQPGNLIEVCEWKGCEFWEAAKFTLRMADVQVIGREQGEPSDAQVLDASKKIHTIECGCPYDGEHTEADIERRDRIARAVLEVNAAGGVR